MSRQDRYGPDAAEASYTFWNSIETQMAQAVRVNGGDGSPATRGTALRVNDERLLPTPIRRQLQGQRRQSVRVTHRTRRPLPSRRQVKRAARKGALRLLRRFGVALLLIALGVLFAGASGLL